MIVSEVFYITAILAVLSNRGVMYHVITNAGTSIFDNYDELPLLAKNFLDKHSADTVPISDTVIATYLRV